MWRPEQTEPIQLIAGGSGIVPLMAMIRSRASADSSTPFRLLYSVREPAAVFYGDELRTLADRGIVRITHAYTRAVPKDWPQPPGRINADLIANATLPSTLSPTCYVSVPHPSWKMLQGFSPRLAIALKNQNGALWANGEIDDDLGVISEDR